MRHTIVPDAMSTNVISARPQDSFAHLITLLRGAAIRAVPVVDDNGVLLGVVSEADLMTAAARPDGDEARRWWRPRQHPPPGPGVNGGRDNSGRAHDRRRADRHACDAGVRGRPARCWDST
jgi:hypothetical protein